MTDTIDVSLLGKVIITASIEAVTGLRIGGAGTGIKIGGVDSPIIKDAYGVPYVPGSSIKGKMRSLIEKKYKKKRSTSLGIHVCESKEDYEKCEVCQVWGVSAESVAGACTLTRLIVRDCKLDMRSITTEMQENMDLPYTEVKFENVIDRIKSSAVPRQIERIPAGAKFSDFEIVYNCFLEADKELLKHVFEAMLLLEDDYLGGMGSRGYGKIKFSDIKIYWHNRSYYDTGELQNNGQVWKGVNEVRNIITEFDNLKAELVD